MSTYKERCLANNANLQAILDTANNLPDAGSGGSSGFIANKLSNTQFNVTSHTTGEIILHTYTSNNPIRNVYITINGSFSFNSYSYSYTGFGGSLSLRIVDDYTINLVKLPPDYIPNYTPVTNEAIFYILFEDSSGMIETDQFSTLVTYYINMD